MKMNKFIFRPIALSAEIFDILKGFSCGVKAMDDILHSQTLLAELNTSNPQAYCVYAENGVLAAFYILGEISMPIIDEGEVHYVNMIDISCLAVAESYRYQGLGTAILDWICEKSVSLMPAIDFIHVEALDLDDGSYSAVGFYEKFGFQYNSRAGEDLARMFFPLS